VTEREKVISMKNIAISSTSATSPDSNGNPFVPEFGIKDYFTLLIFLLEFSELRLQCIAGNSS
jgi:hypothetical protein